MLKRYKRFLADVRLANGEEITAHCPNPGRMSGCAEPGWPVALSHHPSPKRKLPYTLEMVHNGHCWIGVNTQRANTLVEEALEARAIPEFQAYTQFRREVKYGEKSRVDFLLESPDLPPCYVEVKSVTLVHQGQNQFPDAVSQRAKKHMEELVAQIQQGARAVLLFVVQRDDGGGFAPAAHIDPAYARCYEWAQAQGLEVLVYGTQRSPESWTLNSAGMSPT